MMQAWKRTALTAIAGLSILSLAACGGKSASADKDDPKTTTTSKAAPSKSQPQKTLNIQFVPSQNADTLEAKAKPLEKLLSKELDQPVKVSVSTDYNSIVEAMASKQVDVGFLPPDGYVRAHDRGAADVLLQAQRFGIKQPGGVATKEMVSQYRSMIVVKKGSAIKSVKDLKGKKIAVQDVTSSSGYIWPAAELKKQGIDIAKTAKLVTVKGHDQGIMAVLNGDTDAAFVFEDARNIVKKDVPDVMQKVEPLYFTKPIPNDTISVQAKMPKALREKLAAAFKKIAKSEEGHAIIADVYGHQGYVDAKDSNFDIVRDYDKVAEGK